MKPAKNIITILSGFLLFSFCVGIDIFEPGSGHASSVAKTDVFKANETIKFGVYSKGLKVGSGELSYKGVVDLNKNKAQNIILSVSTFSLQDRENVYSNEDFSSPIKVERKIRLFGRDEYIVEEYAADKKFVKIKKSVNKAPPSEQVIKSEENLNNVLLLIYYLRNIPRLKAGNIYKIILPTQKFTLRVKDKRKVKVPMGTFDAYYLESTPPKYKIWLDSTAQKTPLKIQGLIAAGMFYLAATGTSDK